MMENQTLNIIIDKAGRKFFEQYNQKIILIRPLSPQAKFQFVCAAFSPFSQKTELSFMGMWNLYVTNDKLKANSILTFKDSINATLGRSYEYETSGFVSGSTNVPISDILVSNERPQFRSLVFGLGQNIDLDNGKGDQYRCISVTGVPYNQSYSFLPTNKLWVFAASGISENEVLLTSSLNPSMPTNSLQGRATMGKFLALELGKTKTIHFDNQLHVFVKGPIRH